MFGQPSFISRNHRSNSQSKAFLAKKRVTAITTPERDDFTINRNMRDHRLIRVAWPMVLSRRCRERDTFRMQAPHKTTIAQLFENSGTHAGHDSHAHGYIGRVSKFNANLRQRGSQWPHTEGNNIHCST